MGDANGGYIANLDGLMADWFSNASQTNIWASAAPYYGNLMVLPAYYPYFSPTPNPFDKYTYTLIGTFGNVRLYRLDRADITVIWADFATQGTTRQPVFGIESLTDFDLSLPLSKTVYDVDGTTTNLWTFGPVAPVYFLTVTLMPEYTVPRDSAWEYAVVAYSDNSEHDTGTIMQILLGKHEPDKSINVHGQWIDYSLPSPASITPTNDRRLDRCI